MPSPRSAFLFDRMLGRLCTKMRMLLYDAALNPEGETGRFLLNAARAGRVAVTRSRSLGDRPGPRPVVLRAEDVLDQIVELFAALGEPPRLEPFTRCLECNAFLVEQPADEARALIPPYVGNTFAEFHRCPSCGRIFWKGTHWTAMADEVKRIEERLKTI
jgi:hypothetical protein